MVEVSKLQRELEREADERQRLERLLAGSLERIEALKGELAARPAPVVTAALSADRILNALADGILEFDLDLLVVRANRMAMMQFGYESELIMGVCLDELMIPSERSYQAMSDAVRSQTQSESGAFFEASAVRQDGVVFAVDVSFSLVANPNGVNYLAVVRDCSDRKEQEVQLARVHQQLESVLSAATGVSIIATDQAGVIQTFNAGAERLLGYTADEVVGQHTPALFHDATEMEARGRELSAELGRPLAGFQVFVEKAETEGYETREWTYVRHDGGRRLVQLTVTTMRDEYQRILGYLGVALDVTAEREQERALRMLEAAVAQSNDSILITDAQLDLPGPQIVYANESFCKMTGYSRAEVIGQTPRMLQGPDTDHALMRRLKRDLSVGRTFEGATVNYRKDGTAFQTEWHVTPIRTSGDVISHYVSVQSDVTERIEAENALRRRDAILSAMAFAVGVFLNEHSPTTQIDRVLRHLTVAAEVTRSLVYRCVQLDGTTSLVVDHEWSGEIPQVQSDDAIILDRGMLAQLLAGKVTYGDVDDLPAGVQAYFRARGCASVVLAPIVVENMIWGCLSAEQEQSRNWQTTEIDALTIAAETFAAALTRQAIETDLLQVRQREADTAYAIQRSLLFEAPPKSFGGLDIAVTSTPYDRVDGDFYSFPIQTEHALDIMLGDVMGKGVPAALLGAGVKSNVMRAIGGLLREDLGAHSIPSVEQIIGRLHSAMIRQLMDLESFVTLIYARLDLQTGRMAYVDCGHTSVIHYEARSGFCREVKGECVPLGFLANEDYETTYIDLGEDDLLLLYSDGLIEAESPDGEPYGVERVIACLQAHTEASAQAILVALRQDQRAFCGDELAADDSTLLVIRINTGQGNLARRLYAAEIPATNTELDALRASIEAACATLITDPDAVAELVLAVHEATTNIIRHAYANRTDETISVEVSDTEHSVRVDLGHFGVPLGDGAAANIPEPTLDGSSIGGFGLYLIANAVDHLAYSTDANGMHHVIMEKHKTTS